MSTETKADRGARVIFIPPPLYYVAGIVAGMGLDARARLPIGGRPATLVAGVVVAVLGFAFAVAGAMTVIRHRTTIVPHHPVTTLLTEGVYRISRNPMYTGLATLYLGIALLLNSWWPVFLWPLALIAVRLLVIRPEEAYLTQRFGSGYADYQSQVRRWL